MKKFLVVLFLVSLFFISVPLSYGQIWYPVKQFTASWDAVTTDTDGDLLPADATLKYIVWMTNAVTDPDKQSPFKAAEVNAPTTDAVITMFVKGQYYVGISAVLIFLDGSEVSSGINWADELEDQPNVDLWAIRFQSPPLKPKNLDHNK